MKQDILLELHGIRKSYLGSPAVRDMDLAVHSGEILSVVGPSGCGKTTLLRLIAGLERPDAGSILCAGEDLAGVPPHLRRIGFMFQDYALFPHLSVGANIRFGLHHDGMDRRRRDGRVRDLLDLIRLDGFEDRAVDSLSGGEAQRVALARSLAPSPRLLLLDEPLGALDIQLRRKLVADIGGTLRRIGMTSVYVTHDQEEAFGLADRVAVMNGGKLLQIGTASEVIRHPATRFVASFLALGAIVPGTVRQAGRGWTIGTDLGSFELEGPPPTAEGNGFLLIRPPALELAEEGEGLEASILAAESLPAGDRATVRLADGICLECPWPLRGATSRILPQPGMTIRIRLDSCGLALVPDDGP
jgi:ABC-type Fe3+/spermidine/putrescine transport system ATPase subunit